MNVERERERTELVFVEEDCLIFIHFKGKRCFLGLELILFFAGESGGQSRGIDADQECYEHVLAVFVSVSVCLSFSLCALNKYEGICAHTRMCVGPLGWC